MDLHRGGEEGVQGPEAQACFLSPGHDDSPDLGDMAVDVEDASFESCGELTRELGSQAVAALARIHEFDSVADLPPAKRR